MKVGPVFLAKHSLTVGIGGYGLGVVGRSTLSGDFLGWSLFVQAMPLNRHLAMAIDKPRVTRYHW